MFDMTKMVDFYNEGVSLLYNQYKKEGQGSVRGAVGRLYENLCYNIIKEVDPSLTILKNDYLTLHSKSGQFKLDKIQVDWHVYRGSELLLIVECKTYLDLCYLKRAIDDFETIRKIKGNVPAIVFSGQDGVSDDAWGFYRDEYEFEPFFVNVTKKRDCKKPIFKTRDPLDVKEVERFAENVRKIVN